jgi:undecaprenyl-diphosphatase
MQNLNHIVFLWLAAPAHPGLLMLALAKFFAEYAVMVVPLLLATGWLRGDEPSRKIWLEASVAMLLGLLINQFIALLWPQPRPFMLGLGHNLIAHAANSSFPSDHLTGLWAFSFSLAMHRSQRMTAVALIFLGLPMAWARIYLGVHFPLDMLGAALVAAFSAWLAVVGARLYKEPLYKVAITIHRWLFSALIKRGWVGK